MTPTGGAEEVCSSCGQWLPTGGHTTGLCADCSGDTPKRKLKKPTTAQKPSKQWPPRKRHRHD